jgi:hypothetical protein
MANFTRLSSPLMSTGLNTFAHGLSDRQAGALTPDEWHVVPRTTGFTFNIPQVPDSVSVYISAAGIGSADVFVRKNHSIIL